MAEAPQGHPPAEGEQRGKGTSRSSRSACDEAAAQCEEEQIRETDWNEIDHDEETEIDTDEVERAARRNRGTWAKTSIRTRVERDTAHHCPHDAQGRRDAGGDLYLEGDRQLQ